MQNHSSQTLFEINLRDDDPPDSLGVVLNTIGDMFVCLSQILDVDAISRNPGGVAVAQRRFSQLAGIYTDGRFCDPQLVDLSVNDLKSCADLLIDIAAETQLSRRDRDDLLGGMSSDDFVVGIDRGLS